MSDFNKTIEELNMAFQKFQEAIVVMEKYMDFSPDTSVFYYRITKAFDEFSKATFQELNKQMMDETFNDITKDLK